MRYHPIANIFPLMEGEEFDQFVEDIRENGLIEPIILHEGAILDGRNRYRACQIAGVRTRFLEPRLEDPFNWVISKNLHRRHLSKGAVAQVKVRLDNHRLYLDAKDALGTEDTPTLPRISDVAEEIDVSPRTIVTARKIEREAPDLADRVIKGELSQPKALEHIAKRARAEKVTREVTWDDVTMNEIIDENHAQLFFDYTIVRPIMDAVAYPDDEEPRDWLLSDKCKQACIDLGISHDTIKSWVESGCPSVPMHIKLIEILRDRSKLEGRTHE
jgi:hypothetical protein